MRVKNISPDVQSVPVLERIVQPGEVVEVPEVWPGAVPSCRVCGQVEHPETDHVFDPDESHKILWSPDTWQPVKEKAAKAAGDEKAE